MTAHRPGPASDAHASDSHQDTPVTALPERWRDPGRPVSERVSDLLSRMTLAEKLAQLGSVWLSDPAGSGGVAAAPLQGEFTTEVPLAELIRHGLGQLTRVFGTRPVSPAAGLAALAELQDQVTAASRFAIPAIVHEECLTGLTAWTATVFPTPLAWGASFDPALVGEMAAAIGTTMRALGVHQGLAPVLDVARDARWGRVEETIGEDPYLVGEIGTAYVRGLQSAGVMATLKHFAGYSASRAGRNMAPAAIGPREFADVILPPFEMAIREGGARCVMHSYADVDGVPPAADRHLLTTVLREELGFGGVVVADYYGISFLEMLHRVAGSPAQAAGLALAAGVDVELPNVRCYGEPLAAAVRAGEVPAQLVDRAAARVLRQKFELGLLDPPAAGRPGQDGQAAGDHPDGPDLDPPAHRALARRLAEESVVLLANPRQQLPLAPAARIAVVGPLADDPLAFFGCYTFPRHVGSQHPGTPIGVGVDTLLTALRAELPQAAITHTPGCGVRSGDRAGFPAAVAQARAADVVIAVLGDDAGLFGQGSSGEGSDADGLELPGVQAELLAELAGTGRPVVAVLVTGRPYALGPVTGQLAAVVQAFFPGEEGGHAIAGVLSGRVVPSGRLPVELPGAAGGQPAGYLRAPLAGRTEVSSVDPTPLFPFGHGLSYTSYSYAGLTIVPAAGEMPGGDGSGPGGARIATDGAADITCTVRNTGSRAGAEVVQLYLSDPVAQVVRPVQFLAGFARVTLAPDQACRVTFRLHADRTAFCGRSGERVVEPGLIEARIGASAADIRLTGTLTLNGPQRVAGPGRVLRTPVTVRDL